MAFNPCPCMNLQKGVTILAIIDAVLSFIVLGLSILVLVALIGIDKNRNDIDDSAWGVAVAFVVVIVILQILHVLLAFMLYYGGKNRNYQRCRTWLIVVGILTALSIISSIVNGATAGASGAGIGGSVVQWGYNIYEMVVVYSFMQQLQRDGSTNVVKGVEGQGSDMPQPYPGSYPGQTYASPVTSQNAYPMQQFNYGAPPAPHNQSVPANSQNHQF